MMSVVRKASGMVTRRFALEFQALIAVTVN